MFVKCARKDQPKQFIFSFPGDKYEAVSSDNGYKKYMMLKIRRVNKNDFGSYKCVAKNSLGETDGVIKLEGRHLPEQNSVIFVVFLQCNVVSEIPAPTTIRIITHQATSSQIKKGKNLNFTSRINHVYKENA